MNTFSKYSSSNETSDSLQTLARVVLIGGGALALFGISRRSKTGMAIAAAGGLMAAGSTRIQSESKEQSADASFAINCSPATAYSFWRDFENLPRFMSHLESVRVIDNTRSEWVAIGPLGSKFRWQAEITGERQNERIAWRSLPGGEIDNSGSVEFRPNTGKRGTIVTAHMTYSPPAGSVGQAAAALLGKHPEFVVREDLRHFKSLIEAGEVATTIGQTHGPRGVHGRVEEAMFREKQNMAAPQKESNLRKIA